MRRCLAGRWNGSTSLRFLKLGLRFISFPFLQTDAGVGVALDGAVLAVVGVALDGAVLVVSVEPFEPGVEPGGGSEL